MKYALTCMCALLFLVSCNNEPQPEAGIAKQSDNNVYIGKLIISDSTKTALLSYVDYKTYTFDVLVGCECDEQVGDYTAKKDEKKSSDEKKNPDSTIKKMDIGGVLLEQLQKTNRSFLDNVYVKYPSSSSTTSSINPMIIDMKVDLENKTKLEKVTAYTVWLRKKIVDYEKESSTPVVIKQDTLRNQSMHHPVDTIAKQDTIPKAQRKR